MRIDSLKNKIKNILEKIDVKKNYKILIAGICAAVVLYCCTYFCIRRSQIVKALNKNTYTIFEEQESHFNNACDETGYERRKTVHALPYDTVAAKLDVNAESAILINADTGDILYEKNADEVIPPASMTKIFLMYTVFQKIKRGDATLDDIVPLPEETWASHMPPHSSLMFLGKDQTVTLRELMQGLAVCSGNDASHAIALYLFGSEQNFIDEVNEEIKKCRLEKTKIVEPSGYSEENVTTAREMAAFARIYVTKYPESLTDYHSLKKFIYPKKENIAKEDIGKPAQDLSRGHPDSIWSGLEQQNTNKLLKTLEGCDGIKTGYIDESGYNLSLTCIRNGERYISVTMKGPGGRYADGDPLRQKDGTTLMEFAFGNFTEIKPDKKILTVFNTPVLATKNKEFGKANTVLLKIPYEINTVVPKFFNGDEVDANRDLRCEIDKPRYIFGTVKAGQRFGTIKVFVKDVLIEEVPLVAFSDVEKNSGIIARLFDRIIVKTIK